MLETRLFKIEVEGKFPDVLLKIHAALKEHRELSGYFALMYQNTDGLVSVITNEQDWAKIIESHVKLNTYTPGNA